MNWVDLIIIASGSPTVYQPANWQAWDANLYSACVARGMQPVKILRFDNDFYYFWLMADSNSRLATYLQSVGTPYSL